jgi:hypothetical protein
MYSNPVMNEAIHELGIICSGLVIGVLWKLWHTQYSNHGWERQLDSIMSLS